MIRSSRIICMISNSFYFKQAVICLSSPSRSITEINLNNLTGKVEFRCCAIVTYFNLASRLTIYILEITRTFIISSHFEIISRSSISINCTTSRISHVIGTCSDYICIPFMPTSTFGSELKARIICRLF